MKLIPLRGKWFLNETANEINRFTVNGLITFTLTDRDIKEKILLISY